jgi:hypothetical protein
MRIGGFITTFDSDLRRLDNIMQGIDAQLSKPASLLGLKNGRSYWRELPEQEKRVEALTSPKPLLNHILSLAPQTTKDGKTIGLRSAVSEFLLKKRSD